MQSRTKFVLTAVAAVGFVSVQSVHAVGQAMTTGNGDGTLDITVDGYGAFGSVVTTDAGPANYDPVGVVPQASSVFQSALAIRMNQTSGTRQYLSSSTIYNNSLPTIPISGTSTTANSNFSYGGLNVALGQVLAPVLDAGLNQVGSMLTQTYVFTNPPTAQAANFEVVRYVDGDLLFDGSLIDGGGRLVVGSTEYLFEIDSATNASTDTTLVAISGVGGTHPATNRYEIDSYSGTRQRWGDGLALDGIITGDGGDADQFIDAGNGYDVTLGLRNLFSLQPGQSGTYVATTIWGSIAPENIPEPTTIMVFAGAGALMLRRRSS